MQRDLGWGLQGQDSTDCDTHIQSIGKCCKKQFRNIVDFDYNQQLLALRNHF